MANKINIELTQEDLNNSDDADFTQEIMKKQDNAKQNINKKQEDPFSMIL